MFKRGPARAGAGLKLAAIGLLTAAVAFGASPGARPAAAVDLSPLDSMMGRWVGEGRLGGKGNATERIRVSYTHVEDGDRLKQSIRCASAGGNVEVQSVVSHLGGKLAGWWKELVRNMSGDLTGTVTPRGFKVSVRGESLNANMDIILTHSKQVIEIQFLNSSLIGLTLVLERG